MSSGSTVSLYDLLWHPEDNLGIYIPNMDYLQDVMNCYIKLMDEPEFFKQYNPKNGWGTYKQLVKNTNKFLIALQSISSEFENYTIVADT